MTSERDTIEQATALLSDVAWADIGAVGDSELVALTRSIEALGRLVDAGRAFAAGEIVERSRFELGAEGLSQCNSERKPIEFIARLTRASRSEVSRRMRVGAAVRSRQSLLGVGLPAERAIVAAAFAAGELGIDTASAILAGLQQAATGCAATAENVEAAEYAMVEAGLSDPADDVAVIARLWRDALDPDGIEPRYEQIRARRLVTIGRERNGIKRYTIDASPTLAAELDAIFLDSMDPKVGPRFLSDEDRERAEVVMVDRDGELVPRLQDPRSLGEKQHDILEGVLLEALRATREGRTDMRTVGSVTAVIQLADLQAGTGFGILEGTNEVVPASVIQEIACDSGFSTIVLGEKGEPLFHGLLKRHATQAQRRAIIARDGDRCLICDAVASRSVAHHVVFYSRGGPTDIDNLVILCPTHHHGLHQGHFEIRMTDGMPWIRRATDNRDEAAWHPASRSRRLLGATTP